MNCIIALRDDDLYRREYINPILRYFDAEVVYFKDFDISKYSKVVIAGTYLRDNDYLENLQYFDWLRECHVPVLGICAGMQIIVNVMGGKVFKKPEIGVFELQPQDEFLKDVKKVYCLHNMSVEADGFDILGKTENGVVAVRKVNLYGTMFHPEVLNPVVLERFSLVS